MITLQFSSTLGLAPAPQQCWCWSRWYAWSYLRSHFHTNNTCFLSVEIRKESAVSKLTDQRNKRRFVEISLTLYFIWPNIKIVYLVPFLARFCFMLYDDIISWNLYWAKNHSDFVVEREGSVEARYLGFTDLWLCWQLHLNVNTVVKHRDSDRIIVNNDWLVESLTFMSGFGTASSQDFF